MDNIDNNKYNLNQLVIMIPGGIIIAMHTVPVGMQDGQDQQGLLEGSRLG